MTAPLFVLGRSGQLARCLADTVAGENAGRTAVFLGRDGLDLTAGPAAGELDRALSGLAPGTVVVNTTAHTDVAGAERDPEAAEALNGRAPGLVAHACKARGLPLIHISTDFVFDGEGDRPLRENDPPAPRTVYGRTKLAGETAIAATGARHAILRTAWLFSPHGRNFLTIMHRLATTGVSPRVVTDQTGSPTPARALAGAILTVADRLAAGDEAAEGVFHYGGSQAMSWHGFARAIFIASGADPDRVRPVAAAAYDPDTPRPAYSVLDSARFETVFGLAAPDSAGAIERDVAALAAGRD